MRRLIALFGILLTLVPAAAPAQLRVPTIVQRVIPATRGKQPPQPVLTGIDGLRADFLARSGSDADYFGGDSAVLSLPAKTTLAAQALWLRQHPELVIRVDGHADASDTREHALAVGAGRAEEVKSYLVLLGVPAAQISAVSMGKERAGNLGNARAVTILVR